LSLEKDSSSKDTAPALPVASPPTSTAGSTMQAGSSAGTDTAKQEVTKPKVYSMYNFPIVHYGRSTVLTQNNSAQTFPQPKSTMGTQCSLRTAEPPPLPPIPRELPTVMASPLTSPGPIPPQQLGCPSWDSKRRGTHHHLKLNQWHLLCQFHQ
jgi:hypothetical protein